MSVLDGSNDHKGNLFDERLKTSRASYGKYILNELSDYLTKEFGKGFSVTNLKQMRQFYNVYSSDTIQQISAFPTMTQAVTTLLQQPHLAIHKFLLATIVH